MLYETLGKITSADVLNFLNKVNMTRVQGLVVLFVIFKKVFWKDVRFFVTKVSKDSYKLLQFSSRNKSRKN